ncbi:DUF5324 family protein [Streptomyces sp. NPDC093225]|uniref:DUF5324 family protein n=1 Tax=Streptomyces sp. NPDC093225 TaxID=3366034 RepID=UPI0038294CAD
MTRMDSVRAAGSSARESARHAAEVVAPYAQNARDAAVQYAQEANERLAPKASYAAAEASRYARSAYDTHLHPQLTKARTHVPPRVDTAATKAYAQARTAARQAADYTGPRIDAAVAASKPIAAEAASRSAAAVAALKGQVTVEEIEHLVRRHERRAKCGKALKAAALVGLFLGGAFALWKWWDQQSNPDWLVEPPAATEVADGGPADVV